MTKYRPKRSYLIVLNVFLETIEKLQFDEAPALPVNLLLFKEDFPRPIETSENDIKYIPEGVLQQIEEKLDHLKTHQRTYRLLYYFELLVGEYPIFLIYVSIIV